MGTEADFAVATDTALHQLHHQVVDDVGSEPAAALSTLRGDKGIEDARQYLGIDAATIVAIVDDQLIPRERDLDFDLLRFIPLLEAVADRVEDQVGVDLGERAWIGENRQLGVALDLDFGLTLLQLVAE